MKKAIFILLVLSWILPMVHRALNNYPSTPIYFLYTKTTTDLQWYVLDISQMVAVILIFIAFALYVISDINRDGSILILILTLTLNQVLDIVHYVLWFKHSESFFLIENAIVIICIITSIYYGNKGKNH